MLIIKEIKEPVCPLYIGDEYIGDITSILQLMDIKVQINKYYKEGKPLNNVYCIFEEEKIYFNIMGGIINQKKGFYDYIDNCIDTMLDLYEYNV